MTDTIPAGYKQTEIGIIPEDWKDEYLWKTWRIIWWWTPSTNISSYRWWNIQWFTPSELNSWKKYISKSVRTITKLWLKNSWANILPSWTILFTSRASIWLKAITKNTVCTNQGFQSIIVNENIYNEFIYYVLDLFQNTFISLASGSTFLEISAKKMANIKIPVPPTLEEQEAIATTLSDMDNLTSNLDELIQKKKAIKQWAMQELLSPKEWWIEMKIWELWSLTGAWVDKKIDRDETPVRLVNFVDVFHKDFLYNSQLNFWVTTNNNKLEQCNVKAGDVFFTPSSEMPYDIALSAVAMEDMDKVCYSYHVYRLRFYNDVDLRFKTYMFKTKHFYEQANTMCEWSGKRYVISLTKFRELKVFIPPTLEEQQEIATILSDMDAEIQQLEEKKAKYEQLKQWAMQQLLTGKIRLV